MFEEASIAKLWAKCRFMSLVVWGFGGAEEKARRKHERQNPHKNKCWMLIFCRWCALTKYMFFLFFLKDNNQIKDGTSPHWRRDSVGSKR